MMASSNESIFSRYWTFVRGIHRWHRWPVNSPHIDQWRGALICPWVHGWVNNHEAGDLKRHRAHCDITVMPFRWHILVCRWYGVHSVLIYISLKDLWNQVERLHPFIYLLSPLACYQQLIHYVSRNLNSFLLCENTSHQGVVYYYRLSWLKFTTDYRGFSGKLPGYLQQIYPLCTRQPFCEITDLCNFKWKIMLSNSLKSLVRNRPKGVCSHIDRLSLSVIAPTMIKCKPVVWVSKIALIIAYTWMPFLSRKSDIDLTIRTSEESDVNFVNKDWYGWRIWRSHA